MSNTKKMATLVEDEMARLDGGSLSNDEMAGCIRWAGGSFFRRAYCVYLYYT